MELKHEGWWAFAWWTRERGHPRPRAQQRQRDWEVRSLWDDLRVQQNLRKWLEVERGGRETSWESTVVIQTGCHRDIN